MASCLDPSQGWPRMGAPSCLPLPSTGQSPCPLSTRAISMRSPSLPSSCPLCSQNKPAFFPGAWCSSFCPRASLWLHGPVGLRWVLWVCAARPLKEKKKLFSQKEALAPRCLGSRARKGKVSFLPRLEGMGFKSLPFQLLVARTCFLLQLLCAAYNRCSPGSSDNGHSNSVWPGGGMPGLSLKRCLPAFRQEPQVLKVLVLLVHNLRAGPGDFRDGSEVSDGTTWRRSPSCR